MEIQIEKRMARNHSSFLNGYFSPADHMTRLSFGACMQCNALTIAIVTFFLSFFALPLQRDLELIPGS